MSASREQEESLDLRPPRHTMRHHAASIPCSLGLLEAFITAFAKTTLFRDQANSERYFEITNVIRFGYGRVGSISPVTPEKDSLACIEQGLRDYSGKTPKAMKYAGSSNCFDDL